MTTTSTIQLDMSFSSRPVQSCQDNFESLGLNENKYTRKILQCFKNYAIFQMCSCTNRILPETYSTGTTKGAYQHVQQSKVSVLKFNGI